jgi:hypothetical protein
MSNDGSYVVLETLTRLSMRAGLIDVLVSTPLPLIDTLGELISMAQRGLIAIEPTAVDLERVRSELQTMSGIGATDEVTRRALFQKLAGRHEPDLFAAVVHLTRRGARQQGF